MPPWGGGASPPHPGLSWGSSISIWGGPHYEHGVLLPLANTAGGVGYRRCPDWALGLSEAGTKQEGPRESQGQGPKCSGPSVASTQTLLGFWPCFDVPHGCFLWGAEVPFVWAAVLFPGAAFRLEESQPAPLLLSSQLLPVELVLMAEGLAGFCHLHSSPPPQGPFPMCPLPLPISPAFCPQLSSSSAS